jgi:hypothetical protein
MVVVNSLPEVLKVAEKTLQELAREAHDKLVGKIIDGLKSATPTARLFVERVYRVGSREHDYEFPYAEVTRGKMVSLPEHNFQGQAMIRVTVYDDDEPGLHQAVAAVRQVLSGYADGWLKASITQGVGSDDEEDGVMSRREEFAVFWIWPDEGVA